jgi:hypothetical protein
VRLVFSDSASPLSAGGVMCFGLMGWVLLRSTGKEKPPGLPAVCLGVQASCDYALASPAAGWGENQKYAK